MPITLFKKRLIAFPTFTGWVCLLIIIGSPFAWWCLRGEDFFSLTERQPTEVLVVEGWIGLDGIKAAKTEFEQRGYHYIVTSGAFSGNRWDTRRWNYATEASELLIRLGVPPEKVIEAAAPDSENHRTFESALIVRQTLEKRGIHPTGVNIFTFGMHARRSRLVFAKALGTPTKVGVIAWTPPHFLEGPWWKSSERALDLLKETVGYLFELVLNSGRFGNSGAEPSREVHAFNAGAIHHFPDWGKKARFNSQDL